MNRHQLCGPAEIAECKEFLRYAPVKAGDRVLDLGIGNGYATEYFLDVGCEVEAIGIDVDRPEHKARMDELRRRGATIYDRNVDDEIRVDDGGRNYRAVSLIWCSHMLEHSWIFGPLLESLGGSEHPLTKQGWLYLIVPPYTDTLHGGHVVGGWNLLQLMYLLLLSGFDLHSGYFVQTQWNTVALVRKTPKWPYDAPHNLSVLRMGKGDIEELEDFFPFPVRDDMPGEEMREWNWPPPERDSNG